MKKLSLLGYYGAQNLGDELLLKALCDELLQNENAEVTILTSDSAVTKANLKGLSIGTVSKFNLWQILTNLLKTDALIFGGGSIFQDASSFKSLIYYSSVALMAKLFGKKLVLLAQGIGPFENRFSESVCKLIYKVADFVSVRDKASFQLCNSWNVKAFLGADLAWLMPSKRQTYSDESSSDVIVSLRSSKELTPEKLKTFSDFLKLTHLNCKFHLFAFQPSDLKVLENLKSFLDAEALIHELYNPSSWSLLGEPLISSAGAAYCMRFHALLLAVKLGCNSYALSYDPKLDSFAQMFSLPGIKLSELSLKNLNKMHSSPLPALEELHQLTGEQKNLSKKQIALMWEVING